MNEGPNRLVWLAIVGLAVVIVGGAWAANTFLGVSVPGHDTTPIEIRVLVAPEAYDAVQAAAQEFNGRVGQRPVVVTLVRIDGLDVIKSAEQARFSPPSAWIAEGSWILAASESELPLPGFRTDSVEGVALSYMVWGAFRSRNDAINAAYGPLSWDTFVETVAAGRWERSGGDPSWGFPKLALAYPDTSAHGLAALLGAAAEYYDRPDIDAADLRDPAFRAWLEGALDAVTGATAFGSDPVRPIAEQGPARADVGFVAESDWLRYAATLENRAGEPVIISYPAHTVAFDFPYVIWAGAPDDEQAAALEFRRFLRNNWQSRLPDYGLRPVAGPANGGLFAAAGDHGVLANPAVTPVVVTSGAFVAARDWARQLIQQLVP